MFNSAYVGNFDLTVLLVSTFVLFFVGLVIYLRREDRREGYPLEDDLSGRVESSGGLFFHALPKTYAMGHGLADVVLPSGKRDSAPTAARRTSISDGSPLTPTGEGLGAGVGPGAWAQRADRPDRVVHGETKITPLRLAEGYFTDPKDPELRGMPVVGDDGVKAGVVADVWIDRTEFIIRYLEVELSVAGAPGRRVLLPMPFAKVNRAAGKVQVWAILGEQFAGVPPLANPDEVTFAEEDRIAAYYGGGLLYATKQRAEPQL